MNWLHLAPCFWLLPPPLSPYLVASCRLWKVRLGKLANNRASLSPKTSIFPLRLEAWTAARKAFQGCFVGPIHSGTSQRLPSLLAH